MIMLLCLYYCNISSIPHPVGILYTAGDVFRHVIPNHAFAISKQSKVSLRPYQSC